MSFEGTVVNGKVEPDSGVTLPEGSRVEIIIQKPASVPTLTDFLLKWAGTCNDLPEDMAKNHDHYLHGAPKR